MHENSILIHYSELGLKGKNQPDFRRQLRANIRKKLKGLGLDWGLVDTSGFFVIDVPRVDRDKPFQPVLDKLREVFGVAWVTHARRFRHNRFTGASAESDFKTLEQQITEVAQEQFVPNRTFAVQVKRGDKAVPFTSPELEKRCGTAIRANTAWDKVNLRHPDNVFHVSVRRAYAYVYAGKTKAAGGLPVGTSGRLLTLLSGGIDSPAAAYLMARRGCRVDFIHFTATTMQPEEALEYKVFRLAQRLADFTMGSKLYLVPYTYFDLALMRQTVEYDVVLFRRFMMRVAAQLGARIRAKALVTGDNLSQVASQTLSNIVSTSRAVEVPILRPLIGFDKTEIVDLARQIGTYDISIEPYKDCCALIARNPKTISKHEKLTAIEQKVFPDYQKIIDDTLSEAICVQTDGKLCHGPELKTPGPAAG